MKDSVAIVVSYNGWKYLERCLPRLEEQTQPFSSIVVVDNGSNDQTCDLLPEKFPNIELLPVDHNSGFSGGVNHGLMHVQEKHACKHIALVNNDVYLDLNWHAKIHAVLTSDPSIGSCASCLLQETKPNLVDSCGIVWIKSGYAENYLSGRAAPSPESSNHAIFGACAAAALYKSEMFEQIGMFDASLFAYHEDVDLALRAQAAGWRCVFVPGARGTHTGHGSNQKFPFNGTYADYYNARNRLGVLVASLPGYEWREHWRSILHNELASIAASFKERRAVATIAGFSRGMLRLPGIIWRRWHNKDDE